MYLAEFEKNKLVGRAVSWVSGGVQKSGIVVECVKPGAHVTKLPKNLVNENGTLKDRVRFRYTTPSDKRRLLVAVLDDKGKRVAAGTAIWYLPNFEQCNLFNSGDATFYYALNKYLKEQGVFW